MSLATPRLAASQALQAQPRSAQHSVRLHRFEEVVRAGRLKTAAAPRSAQPRNRGRDRQLIGANEKSDDQKHQDARIKARFARRNHSSSSAAWGARAAAGRAMLTSQIPARTSPWCRRTISRNRRRTRLRTTAPPTRFEVTKPARKAAVSPVSRTPRMRRLPRCALPSIRTRANSAGRFKRRVRPKVSDGTSAALFTEASTIVARSPPRKNWHGRPSRRGVRLEIASVQQNSSRRQSRGKSSQVRNPRTRGSGSRLAPC